MSMPPDPIQYQSAPTAKMSRMALTSMILGIIAIPTGCIGVGVLLGITALILGIISLLKINKNPGVLAGKGYAITGIVTGAFGGILVAPLLIAIMLPSLGRARELANRTACATNLNGIGKAMIVYSNDYGDCLPVPPAGTSSPVYNAVNYDPRTPAGNNNSLAVMSIVIAEGSASPKSFLCKSDPQASGTPGSTGIGGTVNMATNQNSYSIAVPWCVTTMTPATVRPGQPPREVVGGWWKATIDSSLPLMADMVLSGPALGSKTGFNSINHACEGQNVGFADAHGEWVRNVTAINGTDIHATSPNPIPNVQPYMVWMTPHKSTTGAITTP